MESYRKKLKKRIVWGGIYCCVIPLLAVVLRFAIGRTYATGFTVGFASSLTAIVLICVLQFVRALHNDEKLRKMYIAETDERRQYIASRCASSSILIILALAALSTLVAAYFDRTVFRTLLAVIYGVSLITAGSKLYYSKKL